MLVYAHKFLRDKGKAEDVVQETFVEAWKHKKIIEIHENPVGWLYITARYKALQDNRRERNYSGCENILLYYRVEELQYEKIEILLSVRRILNEKEWRTLHYVYYGMSSKELGILLGCSPGTVRMQILRIRRKIRQYYDAVGKSPRL